MDLTRVCVASDGCIKANFSDGSIILLSAKGSNFVVIPNNGERPLRQLTEFALSRHSNALAVVLEFRNMHLDMPCFSSKVMQTPREGMKLGYRMGDLWWPMHAEDVFARRLVQRHEDGKITLSTEDGAGRVVLHHLRRRVAVCFPLLIRDSPQDGSWEYLWQTQVFSLMAVPERWRDVVGLLMQVERLLDEGQEEALIPSDTTASLSIRPAGGSLLLEGRGSAIRTELPDALATCASGFRDSCPSEGWWSQQTLSLFPEGETILLEWTPQATYQFHPRAGEVEVWIHTDDSCLCTQKQGRFLSHTQRRQQQQLVEAQGHEGSQTYSDAAGGPPVEQLYAAHCVPESVWGGEAGGAVRYPLASLAAHATKFRQQMASSLSAEAARPKRDFTCCITSDLLPMVQHHGPSLPDGAMGLQPLGLLSKPSEESFAVTSEVVVEEAILPGEGRFLAYADGRLRVCFEDRTILHMNAARTLCKAVLPDGASLVVATGQPVGIERYVHAALAFAAWAFKPPAQRLRESELQARVRAELANLERTNQMLSWKGSPQPSRIIGRSGDLRQPDQTFQPGDIEAMLRRNKELIGQI